MSGPETASMLLVQPMVSPTAAGEFCVLPNSAIKTSARVKREGFSRWGNNATFISFVSKVMTATSAFHRPGRRVFEPEQRLTRFWHQQNPFVFTIRKFFDV